MDEDDATRTRRFLAHEGDKDDDLPERLGRYEIQAEIGRGGMGVVYQAIDPDLGRSVALKVLRGEDAAALRQEAMLTARLRHPNIVAIHDVGSNFIAMELVRGRTFTERMGELPLDDRVRILETVARAAGHAHEQGLVHRDLKPDNVLIEESGRIVLTDFGLARDVDRADLGRSSATAGTPHYMAPEQVQGNRKALGPPTDVWALGVMLYEATVGRKPFDAESVAAVYWNITREEPRAVPGELGAVALRALSKAPGDRYATGTQVADELHRYLGGEPVLAKPVGPIKRFLRRARRRPAITTLSLVATFALAGVLVLLIVSRAERARSLERIREQARVSLEAALALRRAGEVEEMKGFLPPLESAYREAIERAPDMAELDYLMGRMHRALLNHERALSFQDRALEKDADFAPALYERAILNTLEYGRRIREGYGVPASDGAIAFSLAQIESDHGELKALRQAALHDLQLFLAKNKQDSQGSNTLIANGLVEYHHDRMAAARKAIEKAVELDPQRAEVWDLLTLVQMAELLRGVEKSEDLWRTSEAMLTVRIAEDRGNHEHYLDRAGIRTTRANKRKEHGLDASADFLAAVADYDDVLRLKPDSYPAMTGKANALIFLGQYRSGVGKDASDVFAQVEELTTRLTELHSDRSRPWLMRAMNSFYRGLDEKYAGRDPVDLLRYSIRDLNTSLDKGDAEHGNGWMWRGMVQTRLGRILSERGQDPTELYEASHRDFSRATEGGRDFAWNWILWGELTLETARYLERHRGDPLPLYAAGETRLQRAVEIDDSVDAAFRYMGMLRFSRAQYLEKQGRRAEAASDYTRAANDLSRALVIHPRSDKTMITTLDLARRKAMKMQARVTEKALSEKK